MQPRKSKENTSERFQPIWKILVKLETFQKYSRGENKRNIWVATAQNQYWTSRHKKLGKTEPWK